MFSSYRFLATTAILSLAVILFVAASLPVTADSTKNQEVKKRPNILLVIGDDMCWSDCGAYGSKVVKTPNIDRLASEGMTFDRSFTATAMCAPTRQQLYTGIFPVRNGAYPNHSWVYPDVKSLVQYFKPLGYRIGLHAKSHVGPPSVFSWERVGDVKKFITRDTVQPYFLVYASNNPHSGWSTGDASKYPVEKITVPPSMIDTPVIRDSLSRYYAEITDLDREVGECMKIIADSGGVDNTIMIFTSEQGASMPFGGKWGCYDRGLKTDLIIRWPGHIKADTRTDAMVQYVDMVPTLMEAAGTKAPTDIDGRSYLGVLQGKTGRHGDYVYGIQTTLGIVNGSPCYPIRSVRSVKFKYIENLKHEELFHNALTPGSKHYLKNMMASWMEAGPEGIARVRAYQKRPAVELYDVTTDPDEMKNLADDPEYANEIATLRGKLHAWMQQQGDKGIETELKAKDRQQRGKKPVGLKKKKRKK